MQNHNPLLLDEHPLLILPSLAKSVGLNESIVLQQLHYWLKKSTHDHDGRKWVYNSYADWKSQLPFWSEVTIKRTVLGLERKGIIISANFNKLPIDKTKWYSIDYEALERVIRPSYQIDPSSVSKRPVERINVTRPLPEITTENSSESDGGGNGPSDAKVRIQRHFEKVYSRFPNDVQLDNLEHFVQRGMEIELVFSALDKARLNGKQISYSVGILQNQYDRGIRTVAQAELDDAKQQSAAGGEKSGKHSNHTRQVPEVSRTANGRKFGLVKE